MFLGNKEPTFQALPGTLARQNFKTDLVYCSLYSKICCDLTFSSKHVHLSPPYVVTPLIYPAWQARLEFCDDPKAEWVLDGIRNGFRVGYMGGHLISTVENMPYACAHDHIVVEYLAKELKRGSIAGLFSAPPVHELHFNRFGLVPKSEPGQWRMIINLSFPSGFSVNDGIPDSEAHIKFSSVDDAIDI